MIWACFLFVFSYSFLKKHSSVYLTLQGNVAAEGIRLFGSCRPNCGLTSPNPNPEQQDAWSG